VQIRATEEKSKFSFFFFKRFEFLCECYMIRHMTSSLLVITVYKQITASRQNYENDCALRCWVVLGNLVWGTDSTVEDTPR